MGERENFQGQPVAVGHSSGRLWFTWVYLGVPRAGCYGNGFTRYQQIVLVNYDGGRK